MPSLADILGMQDDGSGQSLDPNALLAALNGGAAPPDGGTPQPGIDPMAGASLAALQARVPTPAARQQLLDAAYNPGQPPNFQALFPQPSPGRQAAQTFLGGLADAMNAKAAILGHAPEIASHIVDQLRARREQQKQMLAALQFQEAEKAAAMARQKALMALQSGDAAGAKAAEMETKIADNIRTNLQKDIDNQRSQEKQKRKSAADQVKALATEAGKLGAKTEDLPLDQVLVQDELDPKVAGPIVKTLVDRIAAASRENANRDYAIKAGKGTNKAEITPAQYDLMRTRLRSAGIRSLGKQVTTSISVDPQTGMPLTTLNEPSLSPEEEAKVNAFIRKNFTKDQAAYAQEHDPLLFNADTQVPTVDPLAAFKAEQARRAAAKK